MAGRIAVGIALPQSDHSRNLALQSQLGVEGAFLPAELSPFGPISLRVSFSDQMIELDRCARAAAAALGWLKVGADFFQGFCGDFRPVVGLEENLIFRIVWVFCSMCIIIWKW